jgi:hypothetical protein
MVHHQYFLHLFWLIFLLLGLLDLFQLLALLASDLLQILVLQQQTQ